MISARACFRYDIRRKRQSLNIGEGCAVKINDIGTDASYVRCSTPAKVRFVDYDVDTSASVRKLHKSLPALAHCTMEHSGKRIASAFGLVLLATLFRISEGLIREAIGLWCESAQKAFCDGSIGVQLRSCKPRSSAAMSDLFSAAYRPGRPRQTDANRRSSTVVCGELRNVTAPRRQRLSGPRKVRRTSSGISGNSRKRAVSSSPGVGTR
jgi:hypothetical protein